MLEELDRGIGRLLDELDTLGISENTYVVFTTDNAAASFPVAILRARAERSLVRG